MKCKEKKRGKRKQKETELLLEGLFLWVERVLGEKAEGGGGEVYILPLHNAIRTCLSFFSPT